MGKKEQRKSTVQKAPFAVGDQVTTKFYESPPRQPYDEAGVVRRVTAIIHDDRYSSGWGVAADDGGRCEHCLRPLSRSIPVVDSDWFRLWLP